jgi:hypothetical protein
MSTRYCIVIAMAACAYIFFAGFYNKGSVAYGYEDGSEEVRSEYSEVDAENPEATAENNESYSETGESGKEEMGAESEIGKEQCPCKNGH